MQTRKNCNPMQLLSNSPTLVRVGNAIAACQGLHFVDSFVLHDSRDATTFRLFTRSRENDILSIVYTSKLFNVLIKIELDPYFKDRETETLLLHMGYGRLIIGIRMGESLFRSRQKTVKLPAPPINLSTDGYRNLVEQCMTQLEKCHAALEEALF